MWAWLKEELSVKKLSLRLDNARVLTTSGVLSSEVLLLFRLVITVFCVVCIILSGFDSRSGDDKWFIYLTNWSFAVLCVTFIMLTALSICAVYHAYRSVPQAEDYGTFETSVEAARKQEEIELPSTQDNKINMPTLTACEWYHQSTWLIYNVAFCAAIIVSIAYWLFQAHNPHFIDIVTHALNTVFVLVEVLLGHVPIRLLHFLYTMIYFAVYVIFSIIYWQAGGVNARGKTYIYKILDYDDQNAGVTVALILALTIIAPPLFQLALLGLYKLRCRWLNRNSLT